MNYELEISKSNPYSFTALNGDRPPLVAGSGTATLYSTVTSNTSPTSLTFPAWVQKREKDPFSIEIWFNPVNIASEVMIIGHASEGVFYDGADYILRFEYLNGIIEGRWTPTEIEAVHLVITYDGTTGSLWVNGERVIDLDVTVGDLFSRTATSVNLHRAGVVGTSGIYDSLALYTRALSGGEIKQHYVWARDILAATEIAARKLGTTWTLTYSDVDIYDSIQFDPSNWDTGLSEGVSNVGGLLPDGELGGQWTGAVPLGAMAGTTTAGVHLTYVGQGVTLSYSLDGTTWTVVPNKTTILEDATVTDVFLYLRLELTATGWCESLRLDVFNNRIMQPYGGTRALTFKSAAMDQTPGHQFDYQADWGAAVRNGGYVEIQPDGSDAPANVSTVELWAKVDDTDGFLFGSTSTRYVSIAGGVYTFAGITAYRNGVLASNASYPRGEWAHWVFVLGTPTNTVIRLGNNIAGSNALDLTIGHAATYDTALSAAEAQALYSRNIGAPALRVDDASTITMSEDVPAVKIYTKSWSYVSGGR